MDEHQRKDTRDNTDDHTGSPGSRQNERHSLFCYGRPRRYSQIQHRSGPPRHLKNFPGAVYATDGSNDKGVMGVGFYRLDEARGGCCQLGRGEEGNSSNRAELGVACLALEDAKRKQDREPGILLSDSACFLSSSQEWIGEGKSPSM